MQAKVAAGVLSAISEVAIAKGWASERQLLDAMALDAEDLQAPAVMLPIDAFSELLVFLYEHSKNPGIGVELGFAMADMFDLRKQGFWGYALLSSLTLRQRTEMHMRYQALRFPATMRLHEEGEIARLESVVECLEGTAHTVFEDSNAALSLVRFNRFFHPRVVHFDATLTVQEQAHHRPLHALCTGTLSFGAPVISLTIARAELDFRFPGDPYLNQLACAELDAHPALAHAEPGDFLSEVRERVERRLSRDASLERIAQDLRISARTLQRKLGELGASFQELLDEVRSVRAQRYLRETDRPVDEIAARLGYGDTANFRRAFRRWMGVPPADFRAQERAGHAGDAGVK